MQAKQLEAILHQEIPITQALKVSIDELSKDSIIIRAPFAANKNIHNTAFAGSIYTSATLAGWSLLSNFLDIKGLTGSVVMAKGEVKYIAPINGDILAYCQLPSEEVMDIFLKQLAKRNKARLDLTIAVKENEKTKAQLSGNFAVLRQ